MENETRETERDELQAFFGVCDFCGQTYTVDAYTQEEANRYATKRCLCDGAVNRKRVETMIEEGRESVRSLFGEECEGDGFKPVEDERIIALLDTIVSLTANDLLITTNVTISGYGVAQISRKSDGKLKIIRTRTLRKMEETKG